MFYKAAANLNYDLRFLIAHMLWDTADWEEKYRDDITIMINDMLYEFEVSKLQMIEAASL